MHLHSHLNTSYVKVQLSTAKIYSYRYFNLNTSYVKVQHNNVVRFSMGKSDLNTSYVKVQLASLSEIFTQDIFKYILC